MGYDYGFDTIGATNNVPNVGLGSLIWTIIALVVSLIGCFVIYFMFVRKDGKEKNKYLVWIKSFLRFDKMLIESILKISYIFAALFITLGSFGLIATSFLAFILTLTVGNLVARVIYEAALIKIMIWKNTTEIKNKLK